MSKKPDLAQTNKIKLLILLVLLTSLTFTYSCKQENHSKYLQKTNNKIQNNK